MEYTFKNWTTSNYYNFNVEFNRIESYNEYCKYWLNTYFGKSVSFTSKTDWTINDIVDIKDYNRVKENINILIRAIDIPLQDLAVDKTTYNQVFNVDKANEIETRLKANLQQIGERQFTYNVCGLTTCGNNLKLGGVL